MKTRDIKHKIKDAYKLNNNLLSEIMESCEGQEQITPNEQIPQNSFAAKRPVYKQSFIRRAVICMACVLIAITGVSVFCLTNSGNKPSVSQTSETFIYIDVNPSIELQVSGDGTVIKCVAGNDDAKSILKGSNFKGAEINEAIYDVLELLQVNGYLSGDTDSILVSVDVTDKSKISDMLLKITKKINSVLENAGIECSIIAQEVEASDELKQRAKENGVSVGKMHLVEKMVAGLDSFNNDDAKELSKLSINELNFIYSVIPERGANKLFAKDISVGYARGFVEKDDAVGLLFGDLNIDQSEVEWHTITPSFQIDGDERRLVYDVSFQLKGDNAPQDFKVDCQNGSVVDKPPGATAGDHSGGSGGSSNAQEGRDDKPPADKPGSQTENHQSNNGSLPNSAGAHSGGLNNDKGQQSSNDYPDNNVNQEQGDLNHGFSNQGNVDDRRPDTGKDDDRYYQPPQGGGFEHWD